MLQKSTIILSESIPNSGEKLVFSAHASMVSFYFPTFYVSVNKKDYSETACC